MPPPPPVGDPPLKPDVHGPWQAQQKAAKEADARGQPLYTDYVKCLPDGMPTMMLAMFPMEVLQTPGQVTIVQEAYNQVRRIYLNEKQIPIEDAEPGYWGHSVGHWQGDTLVVNTVGIKEKVRFRGVPHSDQMRIHERIHMLSKDFFEDQITVTDPVYLTEPWKFTWNTRANPATRCWSMSAKPTGSTRIPRPAEFACASAPRAPPAPRRGRPHPSPNGPDTARLRQSSRLRP